MAVEVIPADPTPSRLDHEAAFYAASGLANPSDVLEAKLGDAVLVGGDTSFHHRHTDGWRYALALLFSS